MESAILAQPTLLTNLVPVIAQILEACFESTWISLSFRSLGDDCSGGDVQLKGASACDMIVRRRRRRRRRRFIRNH